MTFLESADSERMLRALNRYRERYSAVHGGPDAPRAVNGPETDYAMFGDLINVNSLNRFNVECVQAYVRLYANRMMEIEDGSDEIDAQEAVNTLVPVMIGMFEHAWLVGYLYRDEVDKDKRLILPSRYE